MNTSSLETLKKLTYEPKPEENLKKRGRKRLKTLLKNPESDHDENWYMAVPPCFNDALDIKWNYGIPNSGWTQSGCFSFKDADTIYDSTRAYGEWSEALKHTNFYIQIKTGIPAGQAEGGTRFPGSVILEFYTPDANRTKIVKRGKHSMTQDDFVRFLISGPDKDFKARIETVYVNLET